MSTDRQSAWWFALAAVGLVLAAGLTFSAVPQAGFIGLDDGNNIFLNPHLGVFTWERVAWSFGDFETARRYMPLGWLGFASVISWQGYAPGGFHVASLVWHLLATVALLGAAQSILTRLAKPADASWGRWLALLATAAWALHPLRTETVAWASGLLYSQASALAFGSLWCWTLRWSSPGRSGWLTAGSVTALTASLLTYPVALGLPVACWLLDQMAVRPTPRPESPASWRTRYAIGPGVLCLGIVTGAALAANLVARSRSTTNFASAASLDDFGLWERGLQALYVWGRYLLQFVWPPHLSPVYIELYTLSPPSQSVFLTAALGAGLILWAAWLGRKLRAVHGLLLAYSCMALPFLGLLEHPWIAHDRYAALLHPIFLLAIAALLLGLKSTPARVPAFALLSGLIVLGAVQARQLATTWHDEESFEAKLRTTLPRNASAGYYLGYIPASVHFLAGRFDEIGPVLARAETEATGWSADSSRAEFDRLIQQHETFLAQNWPGRTLAPLAVLHYLHGSAAMEHKDWATAGAHLQAALDAAPLFPEAESALARCDREMSHPE